MNITYMDTGAPRARQDINLQAVIPPSAPDIKGIPSPAQGWAPIKALGHLKGLTTYATEGVEPVLTYPDPIATINPVAALFGGIDPFPKEEDLRFNFPVISAITFDTLDVTFEDWKA